MNQFHSVENPTKSFTDLYPPYSSMMNQNKNKRTKNCNSFAQQFSTQPFTARCCWPDLSNLKIGFSCKNDDNNPIFNELRFQSFLNFTFNRLHTAFTIEANDSLSDEVLCSNLSRFRKEHVTEQKPLLNEL